MAAFLARWHTAVETRSPELLNELLAEDVIFRAPVYWKQRRGRPIVAIILSTVLEVFQNFKYHRTFFDDARGCIVLEFSAMIGADQLKGVDIITLTPDGQRIQELEVMVRPAKVMAPLLAAMSEGVLRKLGATEQLQQGVQLAGDAGLGHAKL